MQEEETDLNVNAPMHLEGIGPVILLEEDGAARQNASIEGDEVPHVELQEPRVSHLTTSEDNMFLILPSQPIIPEAACTQSLPAVNTMMLGIPEPDCCTDLKLPHDTQPPTTSKAASTQCSPAINTGMPAIPNPEGGTDLVPLPPWPPDEAAECPAHQLPELIQAPTVVDRPLELLLGKVL
jgi:hypothetical protein